MKMLRKLGGVIASERCYLLIEELQPRYSQVYRQWC